MKRPVDPETARRVTRASACKCGTRTLVGLDKDTCAFTARVEEVALSPLGEVLAVLAWRRTYSARSELHGKWILSYRTPTASRTGRVSRFGWPTVFAEHQCLTGVPQGWRQPPPKAHKFPDTPPF